MSNQSSATVVSKGLESAWEGFSEGNWCARMDVRGFIQANYTPYEGDDSFLAGPTGRTDKLMDTVRALQKEELEKGVLDVDTTQPTGILANGAGYLDKDNEIIVGLQTDAPMKRGVNVKGGIRMAVQACESYGYTFDKTLTDFYSSHVTTHNDAVFAAYTDEMRLARSLGILTGLPDAYGRGRIIGDYRRIALYGIDRLIKWKAEDRVALGEKDMDEENIRRMQELTLEIKSLKEIAEMAKRYGLDISRPAQNGQEAVQSVYFGYLAAIKDQNGAAMSLGRVGTFLDIYLQRDIDNGVLTESQAQEIIDDFVIKLRITRQLRTPDYNDLFAGDPTWTTEAIGGMGLDGRTLVTRTSYRMLQTLANLDPAPEPNMTVLWSTSLPEGFKRYCAEMSIRTDAIQYENDDLMRPEFGDDYGIACCVSAMEIGKRMQFFGARANLGKALLLAISGGVEELGGTRIGVQGEKLTGELDYDTVCQRLQGTVAWLCRMYVNTMNIIHRMHDTYAYEASMLALHDTDVKRSMAFGIAGLSVVADSLSAIKYAKVTPKYDEEGRITDFEIDGEYPQYGNDDDRVDGIAKELVEQFYAELCKTPTYRGAKHTLSLLTITSNVVYGSKTGPTPDGRVGGEAYAPGANPMHNRDCNGALASLNSVAKMPYDCCHDGISNTFSVTPQSLGAELETQKGTLCTVMDTYFERKAHHLNVNVLDREKLQDAMENPGKYPGLTIRVSGYAVNFNRLSRAQQEEVIARTFHAKL